MDLQGTEKVASWIIYAAVFIAGAAIVGGAVWYFAVQKMQSITDPNNSDNKRWEFGNVQGMLAMLIVLSFIGVVYSLIYKPPHVDDQTKDTLLIVLGALVGQFVVIVSFYFGSTVQNKAKDEAVRLTAEAAATTASAQASTAESMNKVTAALTGTGNGTSNGDPLHSTTIKVTPPPAPDSVKAEIKITDTSKPTDELPKGGQG